MRALASYQCVPGSIPGPGVKNGLSLSLVLSLLLFPSPENQHFQLPIRSGMHGNMLNELLSAPKLYRG